MLRVWGGGIYEQDEFYDLCDELGICVWQDFMFACMAYPAFDPEFTANVEAEAIYNIKRLRHHASLALWCGNNELEQCNCVSDSGGECMTWDEYKPLFDELLPRLVKKYDSGRAYWPSSEHTPYGDRMDTRNPDCGDGHLWNVWHGKEPFEWYRTSFHRFCSEYGFQSFPEPKTCNSFTLPEERNITSYVMEHHQRSFEGNERIIHYMTSWYRLPTGFENTVWLSQIQQGLAIKYAVEHWRRNMGRCMGSLYWQLNDCWPVASWSSIDSLERWKALHFMAKKFYAPVLVSGLEDLKAGTVEVHISSDLAKSSRGVLACRVTRVNGCLLDEFTKPVRIPVDASRRTAVLKLRRFVEEYGERDLLVWLRLEDEAGVELSSNFVSFCRPKHMALEEPQISVKVSRHGSGLFRIAVTAVKPALWVRFELDGAEAQFDDNFVCLEPGRERVVLAAAPTMKSVAAFRQALTVHSLRDTYGKS
jgi:beta-mannosidase